MHKEQQSPINLTSPIFANLSHEKFKIRWKKAIQGSYEHNEHGFKIKFGGDERQYLTLGGEKFYLVEFHFHHPSEHWIDGKQQTIELHVVNQSINEGNRVVLGIFIGVATDDAEAPDIVKEIKSLFLGNLDVPGVMISTNPNDWLPDNIAHYYRYEGSLTTPEYDENVSWLVFKEPRLLPKEDVVDLIKVFRHPARLPQPLNRRYLLANFK